ncbi:MAG: hypothetical protein QXI07_09575 [Pyrobaculum sp.]
MTDLLTVIALAFGGTLVFGLIIAVRNRAPGVVLIAFYPDGRVVTARKIADLAEGVMLFRRGNSVIFFNAQGPPVQLAPRLHAYLAAAETLVANIHNAKQIMPQDATQVALFRWVLRCEADEATCIRRLADSLKSRTKIESGAVLQFDGIDIAIELPVQSFIRYYVYKEELSATITHEVISAMIRISENTKTLMRALTALSAASARWLMPLVIAIIVIAVLAMVLGPQFMRELQNLTPPVPRP